MSASITTCDYDWRRLPPSSAFATIVNPHIGIDEDEIALRGHLLGDGTVQLFNPGFDASPIGVGLLPWFGFGHCALLAAVVHRQTGMPLTSLVTNTGKLAHTAAVGPEGLLDWQGVSDPDELRAGYETQAGKTMGWVEQSWAAWKRMWLPSRKSLGDVCDPFELALADFLAHQLTQTDCAPRCAHVKWLSALVR